MKTNLPSHPVLGQVISRYSVTRSFGRAGRRTIGHRYIVRTPEGAEKEMTASEWDKQVYRLAPRDVHLTQPEVKVGAFVRYYHHEPSGLWAGTVVKVTRDEFTISPEFMEGIEDKLQVVASVEGEVRREFFLFEQEAREALDQFRVVLSSVEAEMRAAGKYDFNAVQSDPRTEAARAALWAREAELRKLYPGVTRAESLSIY